ncbi:RNA-directed DNA polymerase, eukaryota [Tanacetum coccineum]|uniref:RNA-directed DNA polymerase, eukaryota n=1 Tax=Tanacetum coccineum TaxID=301880 RepID=A0ABQ5EM44_9ASTR
MGEEWQEVPSRNHRRSNADDVSKVAKSVFVTNFPESVLARDLWKSCRGNRLVEKPDVLYGLVVSSLRKFGSFERPHKSLFQAPTDDAANAEVPKRSFAPQHSNARPSSYANVVNGASPGSYGSLLSTSPAMVLEDTCLVVRDLSKHVMGKVNDFTAIPRLYTILKDEDASSDFVSEERIVWMDIEGIPLRAWSRETFKKIGKKWGETLDLEDNVDTSFGPKELFTWNPSFIDNNKKDYVSEEESDFVPNNNESNHHINEEVFGDVYGSDDDGDPFGIYDMLANKKDNVTSESSPSLSHPPGFTPEGVVHHEKMGTANGEADNNEGKDNSVTFSARVMNTSQDIPEEMHSDSMNALSINVQGLGHKTKKEWIKALANSHKLNFLAIQETKMLTVSHMDVKFMWGNSNYDFVCSDSLGNSGDYSNIDGMTRFKKKLQDLKVIIRRWVKTKRLEMVGSKLDIIAELEKIDKAMDIGVVDDSIVLRRLELKNNLLKLTEMEAKDRIQKSKVKWAVEGDENSKFFHGIINKRRSQLAIRGVFVDGIWRSDPVRIKNAFFDHFEARFKKPADHRFKLNFQFHKILLKVPKLMILKGVSVMNLEEFGSDFCEAIEHFFTSGGFSKGCNSSFVTLIPKIIDAKFVNDFRPISLIGCVYKVVTKVLANRLVSVIGDLVSDTQSAFVAGRQILDGPFILDEILKWSPRGGSEAWSLFVIASFIGAEWNRMNKIHMRVLGIRNGMLGSLRSDSLPSLSHCWRALSS